MKKNKIILYIILGVIAVLLLIITILRNNRSNVTKLSVVTHSAEEIYALTSGCILAGNNEISFLSTVDPGCANFDEIIQRVMEKDIYKGSELYSYHYTYSYTAEGLLDVYMVFSDPDNTHSKLTQWRVRSIASHFEDLNTDIEKIRAVHDWLVFANRYVAFDGGAFSATWLGRSSCTGYAFTFYLVMKELGIDCTVELGGSHAWNHVKCDDKWYNIDVTWDDPDNRDISYDWFMKSDADFPMHHHGGATAAKSLIPSAVIPEDNYHMVPNYVLLLKLLVAAIFIIPVAILAVFYFRRERRKQIIQESSGVTIGNWRILMPATNGDRLDISIKRHLLEPKTETYGIRNETCFHEIRNEETGEVTYNEITKLALEEEIRFLITACRNADSALHQKKEATAIVEELTAIRMRL